MAVEGQLVGHLLQTAVLLLHLPKLLDGLQVRPIVLRAPAVVVCLLISNCLHPSDIVSLLIKFMSALGAQNLQNALPQTGDLDKSYELGGSNVESVDRLLTSRRVGHLR